jgi:AAA ATPase domain
MTYSLREVFTPSTIAKLTFVERDDINDELVDALRTVGKQIVVYGHSGCGKTTLLENKLRQIFPRHIKTSCMKGMTFEQILNDPLRQLSANYVSEQSVKLTRASTSGLSTSGTAVGASVSATRTEEASLKAVPLAQQGVTPHIVAQSLGAHKACWVLEDFHKVDEPEKIKLAQCMKLFMDLSENYSDLKMIFIGAVNSGREVVQYDPELRHRVAEVHVPLMKNEELMEILQKGEKCLNIKFDLRIAQRIVAISNGLAAACHQLALNFCSVQGVELTQERTKLLDTLGWKKTIEKYLKESSDTLKTAFDKSVRNMKLRKYDHGRLILRALVKFSQEGASQQEILEKIRTVEPLYPAKGLSQRLKAMQGGDRGAILTQDVDSGRYSFTEPVHRAFCVSIFDSNIQTATPSKSAKELDEMFRYLIPQLAEKIAKLEAVRNGNGHEDPYRL